MPRGDEVGEDERVERALLQRRALRPPARGARAQVASPTQVLGELRAQLRLRERRGNGGVSAQWGGGGAGACSRTFIASRAPDPLIDSEIAERSAP